jgi:hypothetical protein
MSDVTAFEVSMLDLCLFNRKQLERELVRADELMAVFRVTGRIPIIKFTTAKGELIAIDPEHYRYLVNEKIRELRGPT